MFIRFELQQGVSHTFCRWQTVKSIRKMGSYDPPHRSCFLLRLHIVIVPPTRLAFLIPSSSTPFFPLFFSFRSDRSQAGQLTTPCPNLHRSKTDRRSYRRTSVPGFNRLRLNLERAYLFLQVNSDQCANEFDYMSALRSGEIRSCYMLYL